MCIRDRGPSNHHNDRPCIWEAAHGHARPSHPDKSGRQWEETEKGGWRKGRRSYNDGPRRPIRTPYESLREARPRATGPARARAPQFGPGSRIRLAGPLVHPAKAPTRKVEWPLTHLPLIPRGCLRRNKILVAAHESSGGGGRHPALGIKRRQHPGFRRKGQLDIER